jgi:flagellar biosynthesis/type III secretory pathway protein FliH
MANMKDERTWKEIKEDRRREEKRRREKTNREVKDSYRNGILKGWGEGMEKGTKKGIKSGYKEGVFDTLRCILTNNMEELKMIEKTMDEDQKEVIESLKIMTKDIALYDSNDNH